ncbi:RNA-dependent RNA polymerase [viral metagenome]|uniref:RNA-dependent RNA polymerase n=1 Tax=viral metagenome TaxID=1070528 RepID=A0A6L2ZKX5_9ZZZZ
MSNLKFLGYIEAATFKVAQFRKFAGYANFRLDWLVNRAKRFFTLELVEQALTNRRSNSTDEAVIADFHTFEFPKFFIQRDNHLEKAIEFTRRAFYPGETLYPISFPDLRYYPWKLPPNAEAPWNLPDFTFTPTFRDLDGESESPKLFEHLSRLANWISDRKVTVRQYLNAKYTAGITNNAFPKFHNLYNEIFQYNRTLVHQIKEGLAPFWIKGKPRPYYWLTLHARSHVVAQDEPDKIRAVFGAPKLLIMVENMFMWPLQKAYLNNPDIGRLLWGREIIRGGWRKLYSEIHELGTPTTFLSLDWSQFDKRLLHELIDIVHSIWRSYFDFNRYHPTSFYPNANPRDPTRIERLWYWMCYSVKYTPILLPNGELWTWRHNGWGSGFQSTQLMDTTANSLMIGTILSSLGIDIMNRTFWIRLQGDDSLVAFYEQIYIIYGPSFLNMIADSAAYYFNAKLNTKKSQIQNKLSGMSVLGYFNKFGLPYRTDEDLLRHLFFPEREQDMARTAATALGLAYANGGRSKQFHECTKYIFEKIVYEKGFRPEPEALLWMVRANIIESEEHLIEMVTSPFPDRIELLANCWRHTPRSEEEKERLWPTRPGPRGRFFFLSIS